MDKALLDKYERLKDYLAKQKSISIAFSGGVDSAFLLYAAKEALSDNVIAVTIDSYLFPQRELNEAVSYCEKLKIRQFVVRAKQLEIEGFSHNPENRCYLCKRDIFDKIIRISKEHGIDTVAEGSNLDDDGDYRPGLKAVEELSVLSPLRHMGFTKKDIRTMSEYLNIPTWNKPSFACLATRFPYGETIDENKLQMVSESEQLLRELGFSQLRVRTTKDTARIELLPEEFHMMLDEKIRMTVLSRFAEYGFNYVSLDLKGYRTGSMNETISAKSRDSGVL